MRYATAALFVLLGLALAAPAARAQERTADETAPDEDLSFWQELVNVLTAPFRFLGSAFYYAFKFIFYDIWVAFYEWVAGDQEVGAAIEGLDDPDGRARQAAARRLAELGDPAAVDPLVGHLADPDPAVRRQIVLALGRLGGEAARAAVRGALVDPDLGVRGTAALSLGRLGEPADAERLRAMLALEENDNWYVVSSILTSLARLGGPAEIPGLRPYLDLDAEGNDWVVVASAAHALGRLGDMESRPRLIALVGSEVQIVRSAAAEALGELGALDDLRRLLAASSEAGVVRACLLALGGHGSRAEGPTIRPYTRHPDGAVVVAALTALGFLEDPVAVESAIEVLGGTNNYLRLAATELLDRWTGQSFGPNQAAWRDWWQGERSGFRFVETGKPGRED